MLKGLSAGFWNVPILGVKLLLSQGAGGGPVLQPAASVVHHQLLGFTDVGLGMTG